MTLATDQLERLAIDTIRTLAIDGVQQANSGHPGAPMGMAPMAYTLWTRHLRHAPTNPAWPDRDRFVLSAGHASMLLYSLLYLTGYGVELDDLKQFRQWGSITPGPPRVRPDARRRGDDRAAGPGPRRTPSAWRSPSAASRSSSTGPGHDIVDHRTYAIVSDGDLQEGVASEASSLAGHLRLGKLIALYDDNRIQLDGPTAWAFSEDVLGRFAAYGWHTQRVEDGTDVEAIDRGHRRRRGRRPAVDHRRPHAHRLRLARTSRTPRRRTARRSAPTRSASPRRPTAGTRTRRSTCPTRRSRCSGGRSTRVARPSSAWESRLEAYADAFPAEAAELKRRLAGRLADGWDAGLPALRARHRGRDAQRQPGRDPGAGRAGAGAVRRVGGPVRVQPHRRQGERPRPLRGRPPGSQPAVRRARARHGLDLQRHRVPRRLPALLRDVPDVQRLHARGRPARRAVRAARDLRLDARLRRARRGRSHAPARRALRGPARDPQPVVRAAGRRQRDRRRVGARGRAAGDRGRAVGSRGARADPAEAADAAGDARDGPRGRPARRLRAARGGRRRDARADPHRHRVRAPARLLRRRGARGRRHPDARREPAVLGALRGAGPGVPRQGPAARHPEAGQRRGRASRWAGSGTSGPRGRSSGSTTSGPARPPGRSSRSSGSRWIAWPTSAGGSSARGSTGG